MNEASINSLVELDQFYLNLINCFDLYQGQRYISYFFGARELYDVIKCACANEEHIPQVSDNIEKSLAFLNGQIDKLSKKMTETGIAPNVFLEYMRLLELFFDINRALNGFATLRNEKIDKYVEYTKQIVYDAYQISKNFKNWKQLSTEEFEFFTQESKKTVVTNQYAREDGVVSSLSIEKAIKEMKKKKNSMLEKLEKALNSMIGKYPDNETMKELLEDKSEFEIDDFESLQIIEKILNVWDVALYGVQVEKKVQFVFMDLMKKVFLLLSDKNKETFETRIFEKCSKMGNGLPELQNYMENFSSKLTAALNALPTDHQLINQNEETFNQTKCELLWFIAVSPELTISKMFELCVQNKSMVPIIIKVFRSMPQVCQLQIFVLKNQSENAHLEPIMTNLLKRCFHFGRSCWKTSEEWDNATYLALSLVKPKKKKNTNEIVENGEAIMKSYELINISIKQLLQTKLDKAVETFTKILQRLLACNNNNNLTKNYRFSNKFGEKNENGVIATPEFINMIYDLLVFYDGKPGNIAENCLEILKSTGKQLNENEIVFELETINFLVSLFNNSPWWVKYAIFTWYSMTLNYPKRQIPSGIYLALSEAEKDDFEQVLTSDQASSAECYLRSFFELGLFDVELSIDLLKRGYDLELKDAQVVEKIALALVDSFGKKMAKRNGEKDVGKLIKEMLKITDPVQSFVKLKKWSFCYFDAVSGIDHIILLAKAVKIAFEKKLSAFSRNLLGLTQERAYDDNLNAEMIADRLMEIYCVTAKEFLDEQMKEAEELRIKTRKAVFGTFKSEVSKYSWKYKLDEEIKEQTLIIQMNLIFIESATFTRFSAKIPICLQQLLIMIVEKTRVLQAAVTNRSLEDVITERSNIETIRVFSQSLPEVIEENDESVKEKIAKNKQMINMSIDPLEERTKKLPNLNLNQRLPAEIRPQQFSVENELFSNSEDELNHYSRAGSIKYQKPQNVSHQITPSLNRGGSDDPNTYQTNHNNGFLSNSAQSRYQSQNKYNTMGANRNFSNSIHSSRGGRSSGGKLVYDPHFLRPADREDVNRYMRNNGNDRTQQMFHNRRRTITPPSLALASSSTSFEKESRIRRARINPETNNDHYESFRNNVIENVEYYNRHNRHPSSSSSTGSALNGKNNGRRDSTGSTLANLGKATKNEDLSTLMHNYGQNEKQKKVLNHRRQN